MISRRWALAVIGAISISGCSLIYASDLDGAHGDAAAIDGGSTPDEAGRDASTDAPPLLDAGADAALRGCSAYPNAKFCEDFDDETASISRDWDFLATNSNRDPSGTLEFDRTFWWSPNRSGKATLNYTGDCGYARFEKSLVAPAGATRIETHTRIRPTAPWTSGQGPHVFALGGDGSGSQYCAAIIFLDSDSNGQTSGVQVDVQTPDGDNDVRDLEGNLPNDQWSVLGVVATPLTSGGAHLAYTLTTESGEAHTTDLDFPKCPFAGKVTADVGFHCGKGHDVVYYDDVVLDYR